MIQLRLRISSFEQLSPLGCTNRTNWLYFVNTIQNGNKRWFLKYGNLNLSTDQFEIMERGQQKITDYFSNVKILKKYDKLKKCNECVQKKPSYSPFNQFLKYKTKLNFIYLSICVVCFLVNRRRVKGWQCGNLSQPGI